MHPRVDVAKETIHEAYCQGDVPIGDASMRICGSRGFTPTMGDHMVPSHAHTMALPDHSFS